MKDEAEKPSESAEKSEKTETTDKVKKEGAEPLERDEEKEEEGEAKASPAGNGHWKNTRLLIHLAYENKGKILLKCTVIQLLWCSTLRLFFSGMILCLNWERKNVKSFHLQW